MQSFFNVQKHVLSEVDTFTVDIHTGLLLFDPVVIKVGLYRLSVLWFTWTKR